MSAKELGVNAEMVLQNPAFKAAFDRAKLRCAMTILNTKPEEQDVREDQYRMSRAVDLLRGELLSMFNDGKMAKEG